MKVQTVPITDLVPDPDNARRGSVADLVESLRRFGQHRAVVAQRGTNKVLIGNHLLRAAQELGWTDISVHWVDDDDKTALERSLADNLVGDKATWEQDQLRSLIAELDEPTSLPGLDDGFLRKMMADAGMDPAGDGPTYPINARPNEHYDYIVVVSTNDLDGLWLREAMGATKQQSWKCTKAGQSRVITVPQLKAAINTAIARGEPLR